MECPDLLCLVDAFTARGLSNWIENTNENIGRPVVVVGVKSDKIWRTEKGEDIWVKALQLQHRLYSSREVSGNA
jgi:DUF917 family protein